MMSFDVLSDVRFTSLNLFWWRRWEITSDLLFSKFLSGSSIIANFSFKQRLHIFKVGAISTILFFDFPCKSRDLLFCFKGQYSIDKVVSFLALVNLNDFLWFALTFLECRFTDSFVSLLFVFTIAGFYSSLI